MLSDKLVGVGRLEKIVRRLQSGGKRVVFTNGCFDLLHYGHVAYLEKARAKGDVLVVGLNSDASVRRLKGPKRPLVSQRHRAYVMAGLACVDYVVVFGQDTPYALISRLKPDVLVKGGDWKPKDIVGADVVERSGGKVSSIRFEKGFSTTALIEKIVKSYSR